MLFPSRPIPSLSPFFKTLPMKFPDAMTTPPVPASPEKSRIPVMFSATGGWGLPLGVAIHTLCLHASSERFYDIHIVHDGMDARIIQELNQIAAPFPQVSLSFLQLPEEFRHLFQNGNKDRYSPLAYARLMARDGFTREEAENRLRSQMDTAEKARRANVVISTDGTIEETAALIPPLYAAELAKEGSHGKHTASKTK